ncbi:MAG: VTT domain-containing protein [Candidatus Micrarchaeota archaeon]
MEKKIDGKKKELKLGVAEICAALLFSGLIVVYSTDIASFFGQFSYIGIFFISLLAHATILFPTAPFQFAMISIAIHLDPLLVGLFAGVGSAIGELTGYTVGLGSQNLLKSKNGYAKCIISLQKKIFEYHPGIAIFVLAAIPNPFFDFAGIVAGMAKMKWQHFIIWCAAGRIMRYALLAYFGIWFSEYIG